MIEHLTGMAGIELIGASLRARNKALRTLVQRFEDAVRTAEGEVNLPFTIFKASEGLETTGTILQIADNLGRSEDTLRNFVLKEAGK